MIKKIDIKIGLIGLVIRSCILINFAIFLSVETINGQQINGNHGSDINVHQWIEQHFAKGTIPPFSFVYGGKDAKTFITRWKYSVEKQPSDDFNEEKSIYSYQDEKSGLLVKCYVTSYKDFPAVEWVLKFSNTSASNTPVIENAEVVDQLFAYKRGGTFVLHHSKGSNAQPDDYMPLDDTLTIGSNVYMTPAGTRGSSDNTAFPFFNIEGPSSGGVMVAIGWTGKWYANVKQTAVTTVWLNAGMERMKLFLYPKEEIRTPRTCLLFWSGKDRMRGHNQFRQFILAHHTRKIDGRFTDLPLSASVSPSGPGCNGFFGCLTDSFALALIDRFKRLDIVPDVFWMDAGWYEGGNEWWEGVGNWTVDKKRFPNGLKPIADAAHKAGSKFLVWFEPERVRKGTKFEKEHPEWLLEYPGTRNREDIYNRDTYLFNLGNQEARLWLTDYISDFLKKEGIDYYRQDFNWVDSQGSWKIKDKSGRIGMSEIRHIEGLYAFWDSLLVRFPDLIIDNCASGGRRIDLETISRSSPLWQSDYLLDEPDGYQNHTYGLNFYLPLHGTGTKSTIPYDFRSALSSTLVLFWDVYHDSLSIHEMHKRVAEFKKLRPYYYGDYYPLTETAHLLKDSVWLAYQLNRPDQGDGIIMAFRRKNCNEESLTVKLRGVDTKESYVLIDEDTHIKITKTGEELIKGFTLTLNEKHESLLIWYKKVS